MIAEGEWQVDFVLQENKNMVKLEPNLSFKNGSEETYIDEVYLSALGVQLKIRTLDEATQETKGTLEEEIEVGLIDKNGITLNMKNKSAMSVQDKEEKVQGFILSYNQYDQNKNRHFLEVGDIRSIIINGYEIPIS